MAWFKVDDRLASSRKVLRMPRHRRASAIGLWTLAGAWSSHDLTDGFIPAFMIEEFGADEDLAEELVKADMWEHHTEGNEAGYLFVKWGEYQPTEADVEAKREYERERKRQQRRDKGGKFAGQGSVPNMSHRDNTGTPEMSQACPTVPDPSRPVPTPKPLAQNDEHFEAFWKAYPRRKAKKEAQKKFAKAIKDGADPVKLIEAAEVYAKSMTGSEEKYIAYPTTWLNQGRWDDEVDVSAGTKPFDLWSAGGPI